MSLRFVLLPLFVQVALTFALLIWLAVLRGRDLRGGVAERDIAYGQRNWTRRTVLVGNAFVNQFELPVLFYLVILLALGTRQVDLTFVALAWVFALARIAHVAEHTTANHVPRRGLIYGVGML